MHSTKEFSLNDVGEKVGTRCPVDSIDYIDDDGTAPHVAFFLTAASQLRAVTNLWHNYA